MKSKEKSGATGEQKCLFLKVHAKIAFFFLQYCFFTILYLVIYTVNRFSGSSYIFLVSDIKSYRDIDHT